MVFTVIGHVHDSDARAFGLAEDAWGVGGERGGEGGGEGEGLVVAGAEGMQGRGERGSRSGRSDGGSGVSMEGRAAVPLIRISPYLRVQPRPRGRLFLGTGGVKGQAVRWGKEVGVGGESGK